MAVMVGLALSGIACGSRQNLTPTHGRAVTRALAAQVIHPNAGDKGRTLPGFDAQESSIVAKGYRTSLAREKAEPEDKGMVILAAPSRSTTPYVPPASVPEGR
jgi:hypothetical protein